MAIGLIGLMCFGLLGLGTVLFLNQATRAQEEEIAVETTPPVIPPTPVPTDTPLPPTPTDTPLPPPTPTGTPVITGEGNQQAASVEEPAAIEDFLPAATETSLPEDVTPTNTLVVARGETPAPEGESDSASLPSTSPEGMPQGGGVLRPDQRHPLIWAGIGLLILLIVGIVARSNSGT